jgi:hypothetical protein
MVTANQIHADVVIGPDAATSFVFPKVLIKGLPVFRALQPFGVVRRGEVLTIERLGVSANGRAARFRVVTNIDANMFAQLWVATTKPGPKISPLEPSGPFAVDGTLDVADAAPGDYGLTVSLFSREVYRQDGFTVAPHNVGRSGLVARVRADDPYHRPGDRAEIDVLGTGFSPEDAGLLGGAGLGIDLGKPTFEYASPLKIRAYFSIPPAAREGSCGVAITGPDGRTLAKNTDAFTIVPPLWLRGVMTEPAAIPGGRSALKILGRGLTASFAGEMKIATDEPGLRISAPRFIDETTVAADLSVSTSVAAGDYLLDLEANGQALRPQTGSIIQVLKP